MECAGLRQELLSRHKEDSKASLSELAQLKDRALEKARGKWEEERERLLKQVAAECSVQGPMSLFADLFVCFGPGVRAGEEITGNADFQLSSAGPGPGIFGEPDCHAQVSEMLKLLLLLLRG